MRYSIVPLAEQLTDEARGWYEATRLGFGQSPGTDDDAAHWWDMTRTDSPRLWQVHDDDEPQLPGRLDWPVATLAASDGTLNIGAGRLAGCDFIADISTRASHQRRGIMRDLMRLELTDAAGRGLPFAALTATQGGIYSRFGFGVATRRGKAEVQLKKIAFHSEPTGRVVEVDPRAAIGEVMRLNREFHRQRMGSLARAGWVRDYLSGEWDWLVGGPGQRRLVLHVDDAGAVDGSAVYAIKDEEKVEVFDLVTTSANAERALWRHLARNELADTATAMFFDPEGPLRWSLRDPRAVTVTGLADHIWLRVLDAGQALSQREYLVDGEVTIGIADPMGFLNGVFRLRVAGGEARCERVEQSPEVQLDAPALASLYLGLAGVPALSEAGRVSGSPDALRRFGELMLVRRPGMNFSGF